jgi:triosephosphate isomerase (TIM)
MTVRPLIAGNWKMYGRQASLLELDAIAARAATASGFDVAICPPFPLLALAAARAGQLGIGAQDCRADPDGAFTGDVNAAMVKDAGAAFVIVGHSERRQGHGETDAAVRAKAEAALAAGLIPIVCVGETLAQRQAGAAAAVVEAQVRASVPGAYPDGGLVLAYEPVWAIGSGLTPSLEEIEEIHGVARAALPSPAAILYGGSVKPTNAVEILAVPGVDGALVGGASLKAADFIAIIDAMAQQIRVG